MRRKGVSNLTQYIVGWVLVTVVVIVSVFYFDVENKSVACIDGTFATTKQQCPQCTIAEHCGPDKTCKDLKCVAKACFTDDDCDTITSQCVYDRCLSSNTVLD